MDFSKRSYKKELLDGDQIPFEAIERNMYELEIINKKLGGHRVSIRGFRQLLGQKKTVSLCEIGCGGGDNLLAIIRKYEGKGIRIQPTGIDINPDCISVAKKKFANEHARFIGRDFKLVSFNQEKPDIIFASLFCHHFSNEELVGILHWMKENASQGFFINDLHRSPFAYFSIRFLTFIFSRSYLVRNDAPLSVLRGFSRRDWDSLMEAAGIRNYSISWQWAFRWLIIVKNNH